MTLIRFTPARRAAASGPALASGDLARLMEGLFCGGFLERHFEEKEKEPRRAEKGMAFGESEQAYTFALETPGFSKESIKVEVEGDVLTLAGKVERAGEGDGPTDTVRGAFLREFTRRVRLPGAIASGGHKAEVKDGILTVTLAKPAQKRSEPLKIAIN